MRDWWDIDCGDGVVEHHDHGAVYYTIDGLDAGFCELCDALHIEDDLINDICPECRAREEDEDGPG